MSDALKLALTAVFGVAVFVVGQIIQRLFIEPIQEQRKVRGRIAHALLFHANATARVTMGVTAEEHAEMYKELRGLAAELRASQTVIPFYKLTAALFRLPRIAAIEKASTNLMGWANGLAHGNDNIDRRRAIAEALRIPFTG